MSPIVNNIQHNRFRIHRFARTATSLALLAILATPLAQAQTPLSPATCTEQAQEALRRVGDWAVAQCSSGVFRAFAPIAVSPCTGQAIEGLRRVGGWAEVQCALPNEEAR